MNVEMERNKASDSMNFDDLKALHSRVSNFQNKIYKNILNIIMEQDKERDEYLYEYLNAALREYRDNPQFQVNYKHNSVYVSYVKVHIKINYMHEVLLSKLAYDLHISRTYLSRLFKEETGISFIHYLLEYRIDMAKELMCNQNASMASISEMVGFKDPCYFSRVFKHLSGKCPFEFQKMSSMPSKRPAEYYGFQSQDSTSI